MPTPDVSSKVTLILKAERAVRAGEGSVPCVGPQVDVQRSPIIVGLRTQRALVEFVGGRRGKRRRRCNKPGGYLGRNQGWMSVTS